jgi:hypothetical protein
MPTIVGGGYTGEIGRRDAAFGLGALKGRPYNSGVSCAMRIRVGVFLERAGNLAI